jgi:kynureninase
VSSRDEAAARDAADPLASQRERFVIDDPERIYLDGNSLGRLPRAVAQALRTGVEDWGRRVVEAWEAWIDLPTRVGDRLAAICLGAQAGEVLACDSTTVNLYKLAHAVLDQRAGAVVTVRGNFPTDRYVLAGVARARDRAYREVETPEAAVADTDAALVCLSHVDYRSGELLDMAPLTSASRAMIVWDLSHSAGAVPIDLSVADLAVGCSYKYLNAGPGSPAFLYVRRSLQPELVSPIQGWFGQRDQFEMGPSYQPTAGVARFLAGTPPILGLLALDASLDAFAEVGMPAIAAKGAALTELIIALADAWLAGLGFEVASPRDPARRGAHVSLRHPEAWPICRALIERAGVVPDFRDPDLIRLGVPALYTRHVDVWEALDRLRGLIQRGEHRLVDAARRRVT